MFVEAGNTNRPAPLCVQGRRSPAFSSGFQFDRYCFVELIARGAAVKCSCNSQVSHDAKLQRLHHWVAVMAIAVTCPASRAVREAASGHQATSSCGPLPVAEAPTGTRWCPVSA